MLITSVILKFLKISDEPRKHKGIIQKARKHRKPKDIIYIIHAETWQHQEVTTLEHHISVLPYKAKFDYQQVLYNLQKQLFIYVRRTGCYYAYKKNFSLDAIQTIKEHYANMPKGPESTYQIVERGY